MPDWVHGGTAPPAWRKFGSQWISELSGPVRVEVAFVASELMDFALYDVAGGHVHHEALDDARSELLHNMWIFAPEGNWYPSDDATVSISCPSDKPGQPAALALKSCNRCGRFLPVNLPPNERDTLSFSNHCVAKAPCIHASFGRIEDADDPALVHEMHFGFQLECRFCKKFFVNAPLNPQRTAGQMKEDAARRRAFELLLEHLYEGSPQLQYRSQTGHDLAADVYARFSGRCFKCKHPFSSTREMHLDHTRPLALLWPLDEHATALCGDHNSEKRDRPPNEFYSNAELAELAGITGLPIRDLRDPSPNVAAIEMLGENLDWFFEEFIPGGELARVREGKATASLLVKALQKAIDRVSGGPPFNLVAEARRRGIQ
jgi:hypothetical protein